jgi:hypothetical protein
MNRQGSFMMKRFWFIAGILGIFLWCGIAVADPSKYPQYAQYQLPKGVKPEFVYLNQLVDDIVKGKGPLIIDVRSAQEYQELHIKASVSIPLDEVPVQIEKIPKDRPLVLY